MTGKTDIGGDVGADYGPYMNKVPENPFNDLATVREDGVAAGANTHGWRFDTTTGEFQADDSVANAAL